MFKPRKFRTRTFVDRNNRLFKHYYITKDKGVAFTRHEELNNAVVSMNLTMHYSYGHSHAAFFLVGLIKKYYHNIIALDNKSFKKILKLLCNGDSHELNPTRIYRVFDKIVFNPKPKTNKQSLWKYIVVKLDKIQIFPLMS
jgi:hypothetical protein